MKKLSKIYFLAFLAIALFYSCKKDQSVSTAALQPIKTVTTAAIPKGMVMTPVGLMAKENVHEIEPGYRLEINGSHILKVKIATGETMADYGALKISSSASPNIAAGSSVTFGNELAAHATNRTLTTPNGNGWTTYAETTVNSTTAIGSFSSTWTVPNAPSSPGTNELFYIGDGIENGTHSNSAANFEIEPTLQYGSNGTFGSQYGYVISNWCTWSGGAAYSTPTSVSSGTVLAGGVTLTNTTSGPPYTYTASFGSAGNNLNIGAGNNSSNVGPNSMPTIPIENYAFESLQAYGFSSANNYPNQSEVIMNPVGLETGLPGGFSYPATSLSWNAYSTTQALYGEHTILGSGTSSPPTASVSNPGEIQLCFTAPPAISVPPGPGPGGAYITCQGTAVTTPTPTNTGGPVTTWSYSPTTPPSGISYNNGTITASASTPIGTYTTTVTASNSSGSSYTNVKIIVYGTTTVTYPSVFTTGTGQYNTNIYNQSTTSITAVTPTVTGAPPTSYSISPNITTLTGLSFNSTTGAISGPPSKACAPTTYTVTWTGGCGVNSATFTIGVAFAFTFLDYTGNINFSYTFKYVANGVNYGQINGGEILVSGGSSTTLWLPPGTYNVTINSVTSSPPYPHFSIYFSPNGPSWSGTYGQSFSSMLISNTGGNTVVTVGN